MPSYRTCQWEGKDEGKWNTRRDIQWKLGCEPTFWLFDFASFSVFLFFCNINKYHVWREECGPSISEGMIVLLRDVQVPRLFT